MGLLFAIQVAIEMGLQQVCFESDCNKWTN